MRTFLFLFGLFPFLASATIVVPGNTTCNTAWFFTGDIDMDFNMTGDCHGGESVLYYYYRSSSTLTPGSVMTVFATGTTTSASTTYEVFGPYVSLTDACSDIGSASSITSGTSSTTQTVTHNLVTDQLYVMRITIDKCQGTLQLNTEDSPLSTKWAPEECPNCLTAFQPTGGTYILSAWVKDTEATIDDLTYTKPTIEITSGASTSTGTASGDIIDGWQRIETEVIIDPDDFTIKLQCASGGECYFDDIRIFPVDGSMVTYVYDPITLRLMAELDERNYAKLYEYDEEGKLIRVKKETEKGIMTIQESRENNSGRE